MRVQLAHALAAPALVAWGACSTVAPPVAPAACERDEDCDQEAGEVCALDQGRCVPGTDVPPLADLAFDVREPGTVAGEEYSLRTEILGCDAAVELVSTEDRQVTVRRGEVIQNWSFIVRDPLSDDPDADPMGVVEVRAPSRIALRDLVRQASVTATEEGPRTPFLPWPYHHPSDTATLGPFGTERAVVRIVPGPDQPPYERWVAPAAARTDRSCGTDADCCPSPPCSPRIPPVCLSLGDPPEQACSYTAGINWLYDASAERACQRILGGEVRRLSATGPGSAVAGAAVSIRHADPAAPAPPATLVPLGPPPPEQVCTSDGDCAPGLEICDIEPGQFAGRCTAPLAGRSVVTGNLVTDGSGTFATSVYTYCEDAPNDPHERAFHLTVVPPPDVPGPSVELRATVTFPAAGGGGSNPAASFSTPLCLPDWSPAVETTLEATGTPVEIARTPGGEPVSCCDVGCLAAFGDDGDAVPTTPATCAPVTASGTARIVATASFPPPPTSQWEDLGCAPLDRTGAFAGQFRREGTCDGMGACTLPALPGSGPLDELVLRIESPVGSVLGSVLASVPVPPPANLGAVVLPRRVVVRGTVRLGPDLCDPDEAGDCSDLQATVVAERLRMPGETEATVPGPYVHTVPTYTDPETGEPGMYVLPLDPGVWLVTALPVPGSRGDPAPIEVLDLRDGEDRTHDIVLPLGIRVTVELRGFDPRTQLAPWDVGSWRNLDHPGRAGPVRLSDPGECLTNAPGVGCQIRALTPGGSGLLPSITGTVQITARKPSHTATCG